MPEYPPYPASPRSILPRPAQGNPTLERAAQALSKAYPADMVGVDIKPDWSPTMYTNQAGYTTPENPKDLYVNALIAATERQPNIEHVAKHELEHKKQMTGGMNPTVMNIQSRVPYEMRPYENAAEDAAETYDKQRKPGPRDERMPGIAHYMMQDLYNSPAVKGLLDAINKR